MTAGVAPAPPPWRCELTALVWAHPLPRAAGRLPAPLDRRRRLPVGLGGLVAYHDTPVGPYGEVFAAAALARLGMPVGHVPFMAVDSLDSVAGGRRNWALPKVLATFEPLGAAAGGVAVRGDGWELTVSAAVRGRRLPVRGGATCAQPWPDGRVRPFAARLRGTAGLATITVDHARPSAAENWLPAGRHHGLLVTGSIDVLAPAAE